MAGVQGSHIFTILLDFVCHTYPIIKFIVSSCYGLSAHSFLHKLLKQLEAIKFASDWKRKGQEPGGRIYKREFTQSIYFTHTGLQPPSSDDSTEDQKKSRDLQLISSTCRISFFPVHTPDPLGKAQTTPSITKMCQQG